MRKILILIALFLINSYVFSQDNSLRNDLAKIIEGKKATIGIALIYKKDSLTMNNDFHYPTMSTYKFHQALAVLSYMDNNGIGLDSVLYINRSELKENTYSPFRDKHPNGDFDITLSELIIWSVSHSDNNACDILFRFIGGPEKVNQYVQTIGDDEVNICATEEEMNAWFENQYLNWTTPYSAAKLLELFRNRKLLSPIYHDFLWKTMVETSTGTNKIKGLLPQNTIVAHKTGSSSRNKDGLKVGDNDIAIIQLPSGKYCSLAVYIANSKEDDNTNAAIIAEISKVVYDYLVSYNSISPT